jgi:hypothetical protein
VEPTQLLKRAVEESRGREPWKRAVEEGCGTPPSNSTVEERRFSAA